MTAWKHWYAFALLSTRAGTLLDFKWNWLVRGRWGGGTGWGIKFFFFKLGNVLWSLHRGTGSYVFLFLCVHDKKHMIIWTSFNTLIMGQLINFANYNGLRSISWRSRYLIKEIITNLSTVAFVYSIFFLLL